MILIHYPDVYVYDIKILSKRYSSVIMSTAFKVFVNLILSLSRCIGNDGT